MPPPIVPKYIISTLPLLLFASSAIHAFYVDVDKSTHL